MLQLFIASILITGLACMVSEPSKSKSPKMKVNITRVGDIWEVSTDKQIYFEIVSDSEQYVRNRVKLILDNMGYNNLEMRVYL